MFYGIQKPLNKENVLTKVDSYNIFKKYCEGFTDFGKMFKSPLRSTDTNPSASIIFYKGDLLFTDFGEKSYRAVDFVSRLYGLTYVEALQKINVDFDLQLKSSLPYVSTGVKAIIYDTPEFTERTNTVIKIKRRKWEDRDIKYWNQFHISLKTLINFGVNAISHFSIDGKIYFSDLLSYSYDYYMEEGIFRRKIYQPYSLYKWFSNGGLIVQGEGMLPKEGELLVITSSLKDVMVLYEMGYIAIAPTSEKTFLPIPYFEKQKNRFSNIIFFMNNDPTGRERNTELSSLYDYPSICIPDNYHQTDISDFVRDYSFDDGMLLINNLIKKLK